MKKKFSDCILFILMNYDVNANANVETSTNNKYSFDILVACTDNGGIGNKGIIPWYLPPDLKYFQKLTTDTESTDLTKQNAIIMGKNTWNSLPKKPLKNRRNIVLTTAKEIEQIIAEGGEVYRSLDDALRYLHEDPKVEKIFVIGGECLYEEAVEHPACKYIYMTHIEHDEYHCDRFFPLQCLHNFIIHTKLTGFQYDGIHFSYIKYISKNHLEYSE